MAGPTLLYVTQVAPYVSGPAGVHGVLDQSATAMAQLAESGRPRVPPGHRGTGPRTLGAGVGPRAGVVHHRGDPVVNGTAGARRRGGPGRTDLGTRRSLGHGLLLPLGGVRPSGRRSIRRPPVDAGGAPSTWSTRTIPAVSHLGATWHWHDEVYTFRDLRPDATVLLRARADELSGDAPAPAIGFPLSWCFTEGEGRVFSTSLGHFPHAWEDTDYLRHLAGGLAWLTAETSPP